MSFLFFEIWAWLITAALVGLGAGWLLWGLSASRKERALRRRLGRAERNWEELESRLATELDRVAALERERVRLRKDIVRLREAKLRHSASRDHVARRAEEDQIAVTESTGPL